jgi:hypothetical protein
MAQAGARDPIPLSEWQATVSGNATLGLSVVPSGKTAALRLDFDFKGGKGFAVARRAWARPMPSDYAVRLRLRGHGPVNNLEIKLLDATGRNVWRHVAKDQSPPARAARSSSPGARPAAAPSPNWDSSKSPSSPARVAGARCGSRISRSRI